MRRSQTSLVLALPLWWCLIVTCIEGALGISIQLNKANPFLSLGGGADSKNRTLQDYVAAMEEKDANREDVTSTVIEVRDDDEAQSTPSKVPGTDDGDIVGVKSKKSNAVGDPDDDSDDDDDDDLTDWDDMDEEPPHSLQVEVEVVEQELEQPSQSSTRGSGGVGVRLGRRRNKKRRKTNTSTIPLVANAWLPHLYLPPAPSTVADLHNNHRQLDADAKARLDRRTLYSGLLLEFTSSATSTRRYFSKHTAQQLQAALSLATQPEWRSAFPQTSGIMLYDPEDEKSGPTLSMQETIAMSLVSPPVPSSGYTRTRPSL